MELKDYAERIEDELRTIPDVAKLRRYGEQKEQIWITSSLQRSSQYLANPATIVQALRERNIIQDSGALLVSGEDVPLKTNGLLVTEEQIKKILVDVSPNTRPARIHRGLCRRGTPLSGSRCHRALRRGSQRPAFGRNAKRKEYR